MMVLPRPAVGAVVAAAMLALLALAPPRALPTRDDLPHLVPWKPSPQARFSAALGALGEEPRATFYQGGGVVAAFRPVARWDMPRLRIDAAIAATRVLASCRCQVLHYRLIDDRLVQEHQTLIARGPVQRVQEPPNDFDDTHWDLAGATLAEVSRRARELVETSIPSGATRVTIAIDRDGAPAFRFAYRPATHTASMWAMAGVSLPRIPEPVQVEGPDTPFAGAP
jgi:hypothetical protein